MKPKRKKTATERLIILLSDEDFRDNYKGRPLVKFINEQFEVKIKPTQPYRPKTGIRNLVLTK